MTDVFDKICKEIKAHITYSVNIFFRKIFAVFQIMRKNTVEPYREKYGACALHAGYLKLETHP
jgi:hypothetical protein